MKKSKIKILLILSLALLTILTCKRYSNAGMSSNNFKLIGNNIEPRVACSVVKLQDERVLFAGGFKGHNLLDRIYLKSAEIYNPKTNKFTKTGNLNMLRAGAQSILLNDGKVLIVGGLVENKKGQDIPIKSAEIYDPKIGKFEYIGDMPISWTHALLLKDGRVLLYSSEYLTTPILGIFNPETNSFRESSSCLTKRCPDKGILLNDGTVLFAGGNFPGNNPQIFNPQTETLEYTGQVNYTSRMNSTVTPLKNGEVIIIGGNGSDGGYISKSEIYNPQTGKFRLAAKLNEKRSGHSSILLPNGKVLIVNGYTGLDEELRHLKNAELYDPTTNKFSIIENTHYVGYRPILIPLKNGNVLIKRSLKEKIELFVSK